MGGVHVKWDEKREGRCHVEWGEKGGVHVEWDEKGGVHVEWGEKGGVSRVG